MINNFVKFQQAVIRFDQASERKIAIVNKIGDNWFNYGIKSMTADDAEFLSDNSFADAVQNIVGDMMREMTDSEYSESVNWLVDEIHRQVKRTHEIIVSDFAEYR